MNVLRVAAPFFRRQAVFAQLSFYTVGICFRLIDFVNCDNNRNFRVFCVAYRFNRLRHNAVVCGNNKHDNIRNLRTARPHHRKRFMSRRIEESYASLFRRNRICSDVLCNASELAFGNVRIAYRVKRFCLSVVNVSHNCNNRRTGFFCCFIACIACDNGFIVKTDKVDCTAVFFGKKSSGIGVYGLRNRNHHSHRHKFCNEFACFKIHLARKIGNRNRFHYVD